MAGMQNLASRVAAMQVPTITNFGSDPTAPMPVTLPNFPVQQPQFNPMQGYGASRFLSGNAPIPMEFGIAPVEYTPMQFKPGPFTPPKSSD